MENTVERFFKCNAKIENLFWLCGTDQHRLRDILDEMEDDDFNECFPDVDLGDADEDDEYLRAEMLHHYNKQGFLAEIHIPCKYGFKLNEKGKPTSWMSNGGVCHVRYAYAETPEKLLTKIEKISDRLFKEDLAEFKDKEKIKK